MNEISYTLIPWDIFLDLIKMRLGVVFSKIDDLFISNMEWHCFENWLDASDLEIVECLECVKPFYGDLFVVTDASYEKGLSPFRIGFNDIQQFVENHMNVFKQRFLETDVLLLSVTFKTAWIFHHEGLYGVIEFEK